MSCTLGSLTFEPEDDVVKSAAFVRRLREPIYEHFCTGFVVLIASAMGDMDGRHFSFIAASPENLGGKLVSISRRMCR